MVKLFDLMQRKLYIFDFLDEGHAKGKKAGIGKVPIFGGIFAVFDDANFSVFYSDHANVF